MYAMIRTYPDPACRRDELIRAGRRYASALESVPGFLSCLILRGDSGRLVIVTLFDERADPDASAHLRDSDLPDYLCSLTPSADVLSGEVVYQRGL
jgi:heme-degrading monooxygenase HmoA